ncbi:hypothetical protein [Pseudanabaena yagii]|uniref:SH3b domain-containing protein n=1 Tax=Pseudanabaena yagii GIHE-NHR1 TaxID=2722753 RepID=A0ABX1LNX4_9CYAN|nr:hypothetical protein [Pseudanabaena yagii]NMF57828.1 hypothetical protein [Pseudanabaena yagii GIHE-NHR1]
MLLLGVLPAAVQAQAQADLQGNYFRNETMVQAASRDSKLSAGSLWLVRVDGLNCRRSASLSSDVVRTYASGSLLEVEVYRGGSDEVLINPIDRNGRPWMPVRGTRSEDVCFVRANSRYIQPFTPR